MFTRTGHVENEPKWLQNLSGARSCLGTNGGVRTQGWPTPEHVLPHTSLALSPRARPCLMSAVKPYDSRDVSMAPSFPSVPCSATSVTLCPCLASATPNLPHV